MIALLLMAATLTAADAKNHIGKQATVCGIVVSANYAERSKGKPTFLNLDEPYPNPIFTIVIWGSDRRKFGKPERIYKDRRVCATGKIALYRGTPQISVSEQSQLQVAAQ